jgi:hypothetical protein
MGHCHLDWNFMKLFIVVMLQNKTLFLATSIKCNPSVTIFSWVYLSMERRKKSTKRNLPKIAAFELWRGSKPLRDHSSRFYQPESIAGQYRTNPWPAIPDCGLRMLGWHSWLTEKCRCRTNFSQAFRHSAWRLLYQPIRYPGFPHRSSFRLIKK